MRSRSLLLVVASICFVFAPAAMANDVVVNGSVSFAALDGSGDDADGLVNGVFTVSGDLVINGTVACNDDSGRTSGCAMSFSAGRDLILNAGAALYAENRTGTGSGAPITLTAGRNVILRGSTSTLAGALVSSDSASSSGSSAGAISIHAGGTATIEEGATVSAGSQNSAAGSIAVVANGTITISGNLLSGPGRSLLSTRLTGDVLSGGTANQVGGAILVQSASHLEPGVVVGSNATIVSQGRSNGAGPVVLEGCGISVNGLVGAVANGDVPARVALRSGKWITIDGRDLGVSGATLGRNGHVRGDAVNGDALKHSIDLFAAKDVQVLGPDASASSLFVVTGVPGVNDPRATGATIRTIALDGGVRMSGNAIDDGRTNSGDGGGAVTINAKGNVNLDRAVIRVVGDSTTNNPSRNGGSVAVRSYSGSVIWTNGSGDVRPTGSGSGLNSAAQGSITTTACASIDLSGSLFPTVGAPVGPWPGQNTGSCTPAAPSLPAGEPALPVCNTPPVPAAQNVTALEDTAITIVLTASDADGDPVTFTIVSGPSHGSLGAVTPINSTSASVVYTPAANYNGTDGFTFAAADPNGGSATASVTISITPVNDAPAFVVSPNPTSLEDAGPQSLANFVNGISAGPADESGQNVSFQVTSNSNPALFSVQPAIAPNGTLTYTTAPNANGFANIVVVAKDDGGTANGGVDTSAPKNFTIFVTAVNDAPSFTKGANQTVAEDAGAQAVANWATSISAGPADESGQTVSFVVTSNTNAALFSSQPTVAGNGTLTFTPAANANGSATISLVAQDNGGVANGGVDTSAAQTFTITVTPVNDAPSFSGGGNVSALEDSGSYSAAWATAISAGPADESSQTVTFSATNDNNALFSVQPSISPAGVLTFAPAADAFGTATVTVTLHDNGGTANGGVDTSAAQTFTITIRPVNDAPSFTSGGNVSSFEDAAYSAPWATAISTGPANESGQSVTFHVSNGNNALFSVQPSVSPAGVLSYTPAPNANGTATVTVYVQDNGGTADGGVDSSAAQTFTITINAVNDAPSFTSGGNVTVLEDSGTYNAAWASSVSAGPSDESSQTVTFSVANNNNSLFSTQPSISSSGVLTFTAAANAFGSATVTVTLQDNGGVANGGVDTSAAQTFTITITPVNDAPSFTSGGNVSSFEDAAYSAPWATAISTGPANESGQTVTFHVTNGNNALFSVQPSVSATGVLSYTPAPNANGTATVSVYVQDNGGTADGGVDSSAPQSFTITINAVNDAPSFTGAGNVAVNEDSGAHSSPWASAITPGPSDEAAQAVNFLVSNDNNGLFAVQPAISPSGVLTFTPAANAFGIATVTVKLHDDGGTANGGIDTSAVQTFTVTVNAVNDAPSFAPGGNVSSGDNAPYSAAWATAISAGPANESSQVVHFVVSNSNNALFSVQPSISATGVLSFTPVAGNSGTATVTVTLVDDGGTANGGIDSSAPGSFSITITHTNVPPTANNDSYETVGNTQLEVNSAHTTSTSVFVTGSLLANDSDADGPAPLTASLGTTSVGAVVNVNPNGTFTYTPPVGFTGVDTFTYNVSDGAATVSATVSITVKSRVWYVKNDAVAPGTGRSITPFAQLSSAQTAAGAGDTIYVFTGDGSTTGQNSGIVLSQAGERLIGEGVALTVNVGVNGNAAPTQLRPAGAAPLIGNPAGDGIFSNNTQNVEIRGINAAGVPNAIHVTTTGVGNGGATIASNVVRSATAEGIKVAGSGTGTLVAAVSNNVVTSTGNGVDASASAGALRVSIDSNSVTSAAGSGIAVSGSATTLTSIANNTVNGGAGTNGIHISGAVLDAIPGGALDTVNGGSTTIGSASNGVGWSGVVLISTAGHLSFTNLDVHASGGAGVSVTGLGAFTGTSGTQVTSSGGSVDALTGPALTLTSATANLTLSSASSTNSSTNGLTLSNVGGVVNVAGGAITGSAAAGISISGGTANVTYNGSVNGGTQRPVLVQSSTGGAKVFGGAIIGGGLGILLDSNTGATITFGGALSLLTGANDAFTATNGGTVAATGSGSTLTTTTGTAVKVVNTAIGAAGLKFQAVSANGATNGVTLSSTGSAGGLNVTGTGAAGSGGTIQNATTAVALDNTANVQLAWMNLQNNSNAAIAGNAVNGGTLDHIVLSGNNGSTTTAALDFKALTGAFTISNSTIGAGVSDNVRVVNNSAQTLNRFTLRDTTMYANSASTGNDSLVLQATNGTMNVTIQNSTFTGAAGDIFQLDLHGAAVSDLVFTGNVVSNNHPNIVSGGGGLTIGSGGIGENVTLTYNIANNTFRDAVGAALGISKGSGAGSFSGTISGNTFGVAGVVDSGSKTGSDIALTLIGGGSSTAHITGNQIYQYNSFGIGLTAGSNASGGVGTINATITGNVIAQPGSSANVMNGFNLNVGTSTADANSACISFGGAGSLANSLTGSGKNGGTDFRLRQRFATTVNLPGYAGANNDTAAVVAYVQSRNGGTPTGAAAASVPAGGGYTGGAACP